MVTAPQLNAGTHQGARTQPAGIRGYVLPQVVYHTFDFGEAHHICSSHSIPELSQIGDACPWKVYHTFDFDEIRQLHSSQHMQVNTQAKSDSGYLPRKTFIILLTSTKFANFTHHSACKFMIEVRSITDTSAWKALS